MAKVRMNITMSEGTKALLEKMAKDAGVSSSAYLSFLVSREAERQAGVKAWGPVGAPGANEPWTDDTDYEAALADLSQRIAEADKATDELIARTVGRRGRRRP